MRRRRSLASADAFSPPRAVPMDGSELPGERALRAPDSLPKNPVLID